MASLDTYAALLTEWQQRMNLVGASTLEHIWQRHFADSAQLIALAPAGASWLDIGAGGGFPGLVIALLDPAARLTLVESVGKKCNFLTEVATATGTIERVTVANARIEALPAGTVEVITARACAALGQLFDWGLRFAGAQTRWLLPKGARAGEEVALARQHFAFDAELVPSRTDVAARIVVASNVRRR